MPNEKKPSNTDVPEDDPMGMLGDGTEEQNLNQPGNPKARISEKEAADAFRRDESQSDDTSSKK